MKLPHHRKQDNLEILSALSSVFTNRLVEQDCTRFQKKKLAVDCTSWSRIIKRGPLFQASSMSLLTGTGKPRVILGLMTFGEGEDAAGSGARIFTLDKFNEALDYFQAEGYNEVDTARSYVDGNQEAFTKKAHWKERGLTLADRSVPFQETLAAVDKLHKQGKFVQLGLSNFTAFEVAEVVMHCKYNNWVREAILKFNQKSLFAQMLIELNISRSDRLFTRACTIVSHDHLNEISYPLASVTA
ncbi:putative Aflatoxin B1 aldehyde reductase member 2 [Glarea lozoyensis 74030]|uniref:Putative Aflatoxin B1 aldehyde reductase member 2 n=1 Tax=Glarea lozoyensis (strain ATCC 74030 / MF5533) TaxID=1104152 RepID=H0ET39_GLAL7|nr:putative Aflatoxin B1 aldehyde reductase member 2 [Glarea lozoyensis 74030]